MKCGSVGYQLRALPFGLSASPWWSHKLAAPIIRTAREAGLVLLWYVDDVLVVGNSPLHVRQSVKFLVSLLNSLGILINEEKSQLEPSTCVTYLGMQVDLGAREVYPSEARRCAFWRQLRALRTGSSVSAMALSKFAGLLGWICRGWPSLTGLARPLSRAAAAVQRWAGWWGRVRAPL